jgi:hypothetical protein
MRKFLIPAFALAFFAVSANSSLAAPAQRFALPDVSQENLNVCTGAMTTVTLTKRVLVIHDDVDPNLGQHQTGTFTGDIATADGFAGRFTVRFGMNLRDISDLLIVGEFANTASFTLQNGSGALILVHAVFHVTIPPAGVGELKGLVDFVSAECRGAPS